MSSEDLRLVRVEGTRRMGCTIDVVAVMVVPADASELEIVEAFETQHEGLLMTSSCLPLRFSPPEAVAVCFDVPAPLDEPISVLLRDEEGQLIVPFSRKRAKGSETEDSDDECHGHEEHE